jgi:hypothetical protein
MRILKVRFTPPGGKKVTLRLTIQEDPSRPLMDVESEAIIKAAEKLGVDLTEGLYK